MPTSEHTIVINKPIDFVFRNMTCMRGCVNWLTSLVSAEKLGDEPVHVGTQYREGFKFMGETGEALITVRTYNPPYEFMFDGDPALPLEFHYKFEEVPEGTRVHSRVMLMPRERGTLDPDLVASRAQTLFDHDLHNLKEMLEADLEVRID